MAFLRTHREPRIEVVEALCQLEGDAATACREAVSRVTDEPLTRGTLLSFLAEYEAHEQALRARIARAAKHGRRPASELETAPSAFRRARGTTEVLRVLKQNAEIAVRRYRAAMRVVPDDLLTTVRDQCNAWLRHRAWLTARVDAFTRTRSSSPSYA